MTTNSVKLQSRTLCAALGLASCLLAGTSSNAHAETRSYVVSWLRVAAHLDDKNCPSINVNSEQLFRRDLKAVGETPEMIEKIMDARAGALVGASGPAHDYAQEQIVNRGRINGKPVNVYANPWSVPDPHMPTVTGKFAYGFNLDGKGADAAGAFEDPDTHEKGVDNQYFRAVGCLPDERPGPTDPNNTAWAYAWSSLDTKPAWIISFTADDLSKDGEVTITFQKAIEYVLKDANFNVMSDITYRIDPDKRWHNVYKAQKVGDTITTTEQSTFNMLYDAYWMPRFDMRRFKMRLTTRPDGSLLGMMGGYEDWRTLAFAYAAFGINGEDAFAIDIPGTYHALKRLADADPDPATGENTRISAAFHIEAVPAIAVSESITRAASNN